MFKDVGMILLIYDSMVYTLLFLFFRYVKTIWLYG